MNDASESVDAGLAVTPRRMSVPEHHHSNHPRQRTSRCPLSLNRCHRTRRRLPIALGPVGRPDEDNRKCASFTTSEGTVWMPAIRRCVSCGW